jgi:hypothetical protein
MSSFIILPPNASMVRADPKLLLSQSNNTSFKPFSWQNLRARYKFILL